MSAIVINSAESLQRAIGDLRDLWGRHKFLRVSVKAGKDRSLPQNNLIYAWYSQIARELREDDELGWKCYCKLHHGVPILRVENEEYRETYDAVIRPLSYEKKLIAMRNWPVTSLMTKEQLSKYAESMQMDFAQRGVLLEFAESCMSILTLTRRQSDDYRITTATTPNYNNQCKYCRGCKRQRSMGQWDEGSEVCRTCVRRGVK